MGSGEKTGRALASARATKPAGRVREAERCLIADALPRARPNRTEAATLFSGISQRGYRFTLIVEHLRPATVQARGRMWQGPSQVRQPIRASLVPPGPP